MTFKGGLLFSIISILALCWLTACANSTTASPRLAAHTIRPDDAILAQTQASGFDTIVQVFPWRELEPTQDQFHWAVTDQLVAGAEYYGLDVIARLDQHPAWASSVNLALNAPPDELKDYGDYVQRVASRYRGRIKAYIIWNEPNLAIEWGGQPPDPAAFTQLLRVGYQAVKAADPNAVVVAAGLAPTNSNDAQAIDERLFLSEMYRAGASAYFEVLAAHPYSFGQPPSAPESDRQHPAFKRLAQLRTIMESNGDHHKPIWITEMGWTIDPPPEQADIRVTLPQQADYLVEALNIIRREWPWVELVTVWNLSWPTPGDPFGGYSLLDESGQPRPAYLAWQQAIAPNISPAGSVSRVSQPNPVTILAHDVLIHLGDTDLQPPWWPLYAGRKPSLTWRGGFYLANPGAANWTLLLELMQQNEVGARVSINGVPLSPDLPQQDFTRRWLTVRRVVPVALLKPGYNEISFTTVRLAPDVQHDEFTWDDFQVRYVRLVRQ
jgi:GH35 family endo-1,4-beta-xylanase